MKLNKITKFVVSYCDIPDNLTKNHWLQEYKCDSFVEVHIDDKSHDPLSEWLINTYPELKDLDESFFIHIDY